MKENGKVTLTMGFHKIVVFFLPTLLLYKCHYALFMGDSTMKLLTQPILVA